MKGGGEGGDRYLGEKLWKRAKIERREVEKRERSSMNTLSHTHISFTALRSDEGEERETDSDNIVGERRPPSSPITTTLPRGEENRKKRGDVMTEKSFS